MRAERGQSRGGEVTGGRWRTGARVEVDVLREQMVHRELRVGLGHRADDQDDASDHEDQPDDVARAERLLEKGDGDDFVDDDADGANRRYDRRGRHPVGEHVAQLATDVEQDANPPGGQPQVGFDGLAGWSLVVVVRVLLDAERHRDDGIGHDGERDSREKQVVLVLLHESLSLIHI